MLSFLKQKEKLKVDEFIPHYIRGFARIVGGLIILNLKFYPNDVLQRQKVYNYIYKNIINDLNEKQLPNKTYKDKICNLFYSTFKSSLHVKQNLESFEKKISTLN